MRLRPRPDESALLRSYSLSGAPSEDRYRISVKREPNGAAGAYIDTRVQAGDILDASAPRGSFTLRQGERPGGPCQRRHRRHPSPRMLQALAADEPGERSGGFTVPATAASIHLRPRCANSSRPCPEAAATFVTARQSQPIARRSISTRWGRVGVPVFEEMAVPPDADFYICGPAAFISGLVDGLAGWGIAREAPAHREFRVGPVEDAGDRCGPAASAASAGGSRGGRAAGILYAQQSRCPLGFRLPQPARTGRGVDVPVRWSCRTGVCHNCETGLISGSATYRPDPVEPPAEGNLLICCSQPQGDIALDL